MNTIVARVRRILSGHSPTALLHAVDADGHEHKLEVPADQTRALSPGQVLVMHWSVHDLADLGSEAPNVEVEPLPSSSVRLTQVIGEIDDLATTSSVRPSAQAPIADEVAQLEDLLGLPPGRLRGV